MSNRNQVIRLIFNEPHSLKRPLSIFSSHQTLILNINSQDFFKLLFLNKPKALKTSQLIKDPVFLAYFKNQVEYVESIKPGFWQKADIDKFKKELSFAITTYLNDQSEIPDTDQMIADLVISDQSLAIDFFKNKLQKTRNSNDQILLSIKSSPINEELIELAVDNFISGFKDRITLIEQRVLDDFKNKDHAQQYIFNRVCKNIVRLVQTSNQFPTESKVDSLIESATIACAQRELATALSGEMSLSSEPDYLIATAYEKGLKAFDLIINSKVFFNDKEMFYQVINYNWDSYSADQFFAFLGKAANTYASKIDSDPISPGEAIVLVMVHSY